MSTENVLDGSGDDELKPDNLEEEDWRRLPSSRPESYPTYVVGGPGRGTGTLHLRETPDLDREFVVYYEFVAEGEDEIVTSLVDDKPDTHSVDLPYNQFDNVDEALDYMDFVMDYGVERVLDEYGVRPSKHRDFGGTLR